MVIARRRWNAQRTAALNNCFKAALPPSSVCLNISRGITRFISFHAFENAVFSEIEDYQRVPEFAKHACRKLIGASRKRMRRGRLTSLSHAPRADSVPGVCSSML
jgi:hypothetical protein